MSGDLYQFVVSDYFATGEGRTIMLLVTRAYPRKEDYETESHFDDNGKWHPGVLKEHHTPKVIAAREFIERFGGYYASGAENLPREEFLKRYGHHLPDYVKNMIEDPEQPGNLHFSQQFHFNFS